MTEKYLGKIESAKFGVGGYDEACIGLSIGLVFDGGTHCGDFRGAWRTDIKVTDHTKWTEADRSKSFDDVVRFIDKILRESKKRHVGELVGVPVEVTCEGMTMQSWRILTEVI